MKTHSSSVLRISYFVIPLALALALVSAPAGAETVQIASASDWASFATRVNAGETSLCATMIANVALPNSSPCVGTGDHPWAGTFDGAEHTLRLDWDRTEDYAAPFRITSGCTILNLHVTGLIKTSGKRAAGFIGRPQPGTTTLQRCRSSVTIDSSFEGDANHGGFIGYTYWSSFNIYFTDCLFDGFLLGEASTKCGGFVGFNSYDPYVNFENCLFAPGQVTLSPSGSFTFANSSVESHVRISTSYYTRSLGTAQGANASAMSADNLVAALGGNWKVDDGKAMLAIFASSRDPNCGATSFAYQGVLRDAQGNALQNLEHTVDFRIYDQAAGGLALWGRSHEVLLDGNGLFNVALGDDHGNAINGVVSNGLASVLAANAGRTLYVGLTVDGGTAEISPRQKLLTAPYAVWANDTASASGDMAVSGAATVEKLSVAGGLTAASATASGAVSSGTLAIAGRATVNGNLTVSGAVSGAGTIPVGGIVAWSGSVADIPNGWALCDGQVVENRRTPDLRNRFVVGAGGEYAVGATGGEKAHTLTIAEMPSHRHAYKFKGADLDLTWKDHNYFYDKSDHYPNNGNTKSTNYSGGGKPHENRPPYYALCFIMRVR